MKPTWLLLLAMIMIGVAGCGGPIGPTAGVVKFDDGSPVTSGSIEFRSLIDKQRYASRIAPDGSFHPTNRDGAMGLPAGSYEIVVVQIVLTEDLAKEKHTHGNTVPRRYADYYTTGLKTDITPGQLAPVEIVVQQE